MPLPPMTPVESSSLAAVGFDASVNELTVSFRNGTVYRYFQVPAPSIGPCWPPRPSAGPSTRPCATATRARGSGPRRRAEGPGGPACGH